MTPRDPRRSKGMVTRMVTQWIRRANPRGGHAPGTAHQCLAPTGFEPVFQPRSRFRRISKVVASSSTAESPTRLKHAVERRQRLRVTASFVSPAAYGCICLIETSLRRRPQGWNPGRKRAQDWKSLLFNRRLSLSLTGLATNGRNRPNARCRKKLRTGAVASDMFGVMSY